MKFRRRTTFAAPLIISVATSCSSSDKPSDKPKQYAGPHWSVFMAPDGCKALAMDGDAPSTSPAREVACPPGSSGRNVVRIAQRADKICAVLPDDCFDEKCLETPTQCPLEVGKSLPKKLGAIMEIELRDGECHVEEHDPDCPPNVDCNPPAPKKVTCPPGITEEQNMGIALLPDGNCAVVPDGCELQDCVGARTECPK
ncbi:MAG: hypothetical protein AB7T06_09825 [Kofleriaceae bacterium]